MKELSPNLKRLKFGDFCLNSKEQDLRKNIFKKIHKFSTQKASIFQIQKFSSPSKFFPYLFTLQSRSNFRSLKTSRSTKTNPFRFSSKQQNLLRVRQKRPRKFQLVKSQNLNELKMHIRIEFYSIAGQITKNVTRICDFGLPCYGFFEINKC
jgi:hypothetical protein